MSWSRTLPARLRPLAVAAAVSTALILTMLPSTANALPAPTRSAETGSAVGVSPQAVPLACRVSGSASGTCGFSLGATGAVLTVSFTTVHPRCVGSQGTPGGCWGGVLAYGVINGAKGGTTTCAGKPLRGGVHVFFDGAGDSVSCQVVFSWAAGTTITEFGINLTETGETSGSDLYLDAQYGARVTYPRSPYASWFADPTPGKPAGTYTFVATSSSAYEGRTIASYTWDFGDGTPVQIRTDSSFERRFTRSGSFTVRMHVTDSGGLVSTDYTRVMNPTVPALVVGVAPVTPPGGLKIGDALNVPVRILASGTSVTGVRLTVIGATPGVLTIGALTPVVPGAGFDLALGETKLFTLAVRGLGAGTSRIVVTAVGKDSGDAAITGQGFGTVGVASRTLRVVTSIAPGKIALPVSKKGKVGTKTVSVTVKLSNTGKSALKGVEVLRLWPRPVTKTDPLDQLDFAKGSFPIKIGTIKAGKTVTKKLTLKVTGDGKYKVDSLAMFNDGKRNEVVTGTAGQFTVTVPVMWFDADLDGSSVKGKGKVDFVKGGKSFFLSGEIRNLSSYRHMCLWPLLPAFKGNAGGTGPVDIRTYGTGRDVVAPPVAGPLAPGRTLPFAMNVRTRSDGGTRAVIKLNPRATAIKAGAACDVVSITRMSPIGAADKKITKGSLSHTGGIDVSVPSVRPVGRGELIANVFGGFTLGSIETVATTLQGTVIAAREAFSGYTSNPELLLPTFEAINATAAILISYWDTATPAEKAQLFGQVRSAMRRASGDAWKTVSVGVSASFEGFMSKVENAYATGDNRALAYAVGYGAGSTVTGIGIDMVTAELGVGLAKKLPVLQRTFARLGGEAVTFAAMRDIPTGKLLNVTEMKRLWGASLADVAAFKRIAREENVLIGIRSRAPISVENLNRGAVWKHENLKPKNVSRVDIAYLGFDKADNGLVAMKRYSKAERAAVEARVKKARLSPTQRAEVLDRMSTRFEEADKYLAKIEKFSQDGTIDVGFNYSDNGIDAATAEKSRKFRLSGDKQASGSTYYRPWQENAVRSFPPGSPLPNWCKDFGAALGVLCRVTGDMDGVYLTTINGRPLPLNKLMRVYEKLAQAGWQHPETFTWTNQMTGEFFFKSKEKILKGLTKGGEKMMEFAPDGKVRATWIDLKKSYFGTARDYSIGRVGGFVNLAR